MNHSTKHILKFGGTSLQSESFIRQSAQIVIDRSHSARPFVVVSAVGKVTDTLLALADGSAEKPEKDRTIAELEQQHLTLFDRLVSGKDKRRTELNELFGELRQTVHAYPQASREQRARKDRILSVGERASALIFAAALSHQGTSAEAFSANQFIKTDSTFGQANVQVDATKKLVGQFLRQSKSVPVVTGFIGSDSHNRITTLGRSGSDYTAGLLADALDADHLEIWTDVNGVLSADPRWVTTAEPIEELSFADINELSAHGASVIHPKTIRPITEKKTSLRVKNSYNPSHPGTFIDKEYRSNGTFKTITITGPFVQLEIEDRLTMDFLTLLENKLENDPDPEAFSFHRASSYEPARFLIRQPLYDSIQDALSNWADIHGLHLNPERELFKVKKFSNRFKEDEQITEKIWNLLAAKNLRPFSIKRNRKERFISLLFNRKEARQAARLLNDYLPHKKTTIDLFVAGTGAVGQTLLNQLKKIESDHINFRLLGICNSRRACWDDNGLPFDKKINSTDSEETNWPVLIERLTADYRHNVIFADITGSREVARLYPKLLEKGIHIATPSKLANTFEQSFFDRLQATAHENNAVFKYEPTVGAGLPVISTIENLQQSGDKITEISGVVSGTMTYLFNQLNQGIPFSRAIVEARDLGYAEPDPRDDLSGEDVARKFLTLARTLGHQIERNELTVESLIPEDLQDVNREDFLANLSRVDDYWKEKVRSAQRKDEVLCYTGRFKDGKINIGIELVSKSSPLGRLTGTDNLIQIYSGYYNQTPLVIQGPGAGKNVTAAGVLGDILQIGNSLS
ncbi:MAG TPA: aspartate kinase [Fodinibius sp.]|nr:aspartate kinase [Fodinibius sp.]